MISVGNALSAPPARQAAAAGSSGAASPKLSSHDEILSPRRCALRSNAFFWSADSRMANRSSFLLAALRRVRVGMGYLYKHRAYPSRGLTRTPFVRTFSP